LIPATQVIVKVKDTGIGIDSEIFPQLFSKFASKSFEDIGLGLLFTAKYIIEAHDGKMWDENNNNNNINTHREKGATFHFTLPTINRQANLKMVVNQ
jgi:two-component system sensor histidine kinase VicK